MKKIVPILLIVMLFGCGSNNMKSKMTKVDSGVFCVIFPDDPNFKSQLIPINSKDTIQLNLYRYDNDDVSYYLSYNSYPKGYQLGNVSNALENSVKGILNNINGTLTKKTTIYNQGFEGRQIEINLENDRIIYTRLFYIKEYLVQFGIELPQGYNINKYSKFLDSFNVNTSKNKVDNLGVNRQLLVSIREGKFTINENNITQEKDINDQFRTLSNDYIIEQNGNKVRLKFFFIDNSKTEFGSMLLYNTYFTQQGSKDELLIDQGYIPLHGTTFNSTYNLSIKGNKIEFKYSIEILD